MSAISFSLPSHSICETGQALVQTQPHVFQLVNLPDLNLDFCPDVLILDNKHYTYQGVEHGRAIYTLTEMLERQVIDQVFVETLNDLIAVSRKDYGYVEKGSRVEVELKDLSLHVDAHNPAYPPCPRCENLAKVLSDLLENPPGFEGIKVGSDHFGNKYIDYGWLEAIRRVQTAVVPLSCGTITGKDQK